MSQEEFTSSVKEQGPCKNPGCSKIAIPRNGNFPYCSKSCRGKVDYQEKYAEYNHLLNSIKSDIRKQDSALEKAYEQFPSKPGPVQLLPIFGYIDGVHHKIVECTETKQIFQVYGKFAISLNKEKATFIISPNYEF
jgi:hypothetical protein